MENVSGVTAWLKKKIQENGGDVERETLNLVMTKDGLPYYVDEDGEYWRVYLFIEDATCYDMVKDEEDFYQSAVAFGHFGKALYEVFKYIGVDVKEIGYNQPAGARYPTENPFA